MHTGMGTRVQHGAGTHGNTWLSGGLMPSPAISTGGFLMVVKSKYHHCPSRAAGVRTAATSTCSCSVSGVSSQPD